MNPLATQQPDWAVRAAEEIIALDLDCWNKPDAKHIYAAIIRAHSPDAGKMRAALERLVQQTDCAVLKAGERCARVKCPACDAIEVLAAPVVEVVNTVELDKLNLLLTEYGDLNFDCGESDCDHEKLRALNEKCKASRDRIIAYVRAALASVPQGVNEERLRFMADDCAHKWVSQSTVTPEQRRRDLIYGYRAGFQYAANHGVRAEPIPASTLADELATALKAVRNVPDGDVHGTYVRLPFHLQIEVDALLERYEQRKVKQ